MAKTLKQVRDEAAQIVVFQRMTRRLEAMIAGASGCDDVGLVPSPPAIPGPTFDALYNQAWKTMEEAADRYVACDPKAADEALMMIEALCECVGTHGSVEETHVLADAIGRADWRAKGISDDHSHSAYVTRTFEELDRLRQSGLDLISIADELEANPHDYPGGAASAKCIASALRQEAQSALN